MYKRRKLDFVEVGLLVAAASIMFFLICLVIFAIFYVSPLFFLAFIPMGGLSIGMLGMMYDRKEI